MSLTNLYANSTYSSPARQVSALAKLFPSVVFYLKIGAIIYSSSRPAAADNYTDENWIEDSWRIVDFVESVGGRLKIEGLDHIRLADAPCLFVGNHMSTLETFLLPGMIQPWKPVTFVIKKSLQEYPFFGHIMRSRKPVVLGRENAREDLSIMFGEGEKRLDEGKSLVVFPQSTRTSQFDPHAFNTIGVKLARRAGVPIIPIALCTDFWSNGSLIKDIGPIHPERIVHIRFGEPMRVQGNGKAEHAAICSFIMSSLEEWKTEDKKPLPSC